MEVIGALLAGALIGSVLGFVGAGGAMLTVPILVYGFSFPAQLALVASLAVVIAAALSGVYPRFKSGEVLIKEALIIWVLSTFTNVASANLADNLSEATLLTGFCAVIIFAGLTMLKKPITASEKRIPIPVLILLAMLIGVITGLFGIGGGFLAIPVLVLGFNVPQNKAAGTSLLIIILNCSTALLAHNSDWSKIDWQIPIFVAISAVAIASWAGRKSTQINSALLRKSFAYLLFAIAAFTLIETWILQA